MPASVNSTSCFLDITSHLVAVFGQPSGMASCFISGLPDFVTKRLAGMARSYGCPDITSHLAVVL
jgi:hypothetical protein